MSARARVELAVPGTLWVAPERARAEGFRCEYLGATRVQVWLGSGMVLRATRLGEAKSILLRGGLPEVELTNITGFAVETAAADRGPGAQNTGTRGPRAAGRGGARGRRAGAARSGTTAVVSPGGQPSVAGRNATASPVAHAPACATEAGSPGASTPDIHRLGECAVWSAGDPDLTVVRPQKMEAGYGLGESAARSSTAGGAADAPGPGARDVVINTDITGDPDQTVLRAVPAGTTAEPPAEDSDLTVVRGRGAEPTGCPEETIIRRPAPRETPAPGPSAVSAEGPGPDPESTVLREHAAALAGDPAPAAHRAARAQRPRARTTPVLSARPVAAGAAGERDQTDPSAWLPAAAAHGWCLVLSAGGTEERYPLRGTVILGRAPELPHGADRSQTELIAVRSPGGEVSANHVRFRHEHNSVVVRDLWTSNGTMVTVGAAAPHPAPLAPAALAPRHRLRSGDEIPLSPGSVVELGDGITVTLEYHASQHHPTSKGITS
ncbi:FHA domain-containing protein [Mycetocola spongiae]|uniref:FHA domain-containing protein n=1 Tax=Mycetocola spongiae TaxID=2859226 RepID=UPI001CF1FD5D|nr:FHA domain-containing protein [Mycetocola spongiae]UCR89973.1 FHA domain-containing protein [Mycetocola spongiae]